MRQLFGTDGIRGKAFEFPLTTDFVTRLGSAIAAVLSKPDQLSLAIIGRDTRTSGLMIEGALAAGLTSQGFDVVEVGVLPTPGIAFLARSMNARCSISISASHNPYEDNGIKVFGSDGFKIPDEIEAAIEEIAQAARRPKIDVPSGQIRSNESAAQPYENFLLDATARVPILLGKRVAVDCNNGAAYEFAPRVLNELGAEVILLNARPDGTNINRGYDALEPNSLRDTVLRARAYFGVQFDGDGDRAVFVDEFGHFVDGDFVLAILARDFIERGSLTPRTVVSTVMANIGLEKSLAEIGTTLERTAVGDRWVTERMRALGGELGGEQSGHIVMFDQGHTTGDGLYTTIRLAQVMAQKKASLAALAQCMKKSPQVLVNVRVPRKPPLETLPQIQSQLKRTRSALGDSARILLRYSGTEDLARVMIEGADAARIATEANAIARVIQETII
jgi:phosphoglucosamine mutase